MSTPVRNESVADAVAASPAAPATEASTPSAVTASPTSPAKADTCCCSAELLKDYIKAVVFGGLDGVTSTFAIVAAAAGANEDWKTVLVFGFAHVVGHAWSMGFGEAISGQAERDRLSSERERLAAEVSGDLDAARAEMVAHYQERGYTDAEASQLVDLVSRDEKRFVELVAVELLGKAVDQDETAQCVPAKQGLVMFVTFIVLGVLPVLPYLGGRGQGADWVFGISCALAATGLTLLGGLKGYLTETNVPLTALWMLVQGLFGGGVSFAVGVLVSYIVHGEVNLAEAAA